MADNIQIRRARTSDGHAICRINGNSLGYTYDEAKTCRNLAKLLASRDVVFVAELDGGVSGYIHASPYVCTYHDGLVNIMVLAVDACCRRRGLGRRLIDAAENWARESGCGGVRLDSGFNRHEAHIFYACCGYAHRKDHKNFIKLFAAP